MEERPRERLDPTKVRDQPALRSSSGTVWIVSGGLFLLVVASVLAWIIVSSGKVFGSPVHLPIIPRGEITIDLDEPGMHETA